MRNLSRIFLPLLAVSFSAALAQAPNTPAPAQQAAAQTPTASAQVGPALQNLQQTLPQLRLDRWKVKGPVREEASSNLDSIQRDLNGTLPGLLAQADAAPASVSKTLPVYRNLDALYAVLLRVTESARLTAPENDANTLQNSLRMLDDARRSLGDSIQTSAVLLENHLNDATTQLRAARQAAPMQAVLAKTQVVSDGEPAPAHKVVHHKPKPKPQEKPSPAAPAAAPANPAPQK